MGIKGIRVNARQTKAMRCQVSESQVENSGQYPFSVCRKGVSSSSIIYVECHRWEHKRC